MLANTTTGSSIKVCNIKYLPFLSVIWMIILMLCCVGISVHTEHVLLISEL